MFVRSNNPQEVRLNQDLQRLARGLRQQATPAEEQLWPYLRGKKLGVKFRRQHPLFNYIIDFYCHELKLIVEVDGPVHEHQLNRDKSRDQFFRLHGYTILRFTNEQVLSDIDGVLKMIQARTSPVLRLAKPRSEHPLLS